MPLTALTTVLPEVYWTTRSLISSIVSPIPGS
jgi:hypothetical protein